MIHDLAWWTFIGALAWGGVLGVVVLFMMGCHKNDDS